MEFIEIVKQLEPRLRKVACEITDNKADEDDLLQEGRLHLWENREKLRNKSISYILRGCYFRFIDYFRRGRSINDKSRDGVVVISLYWVRKKEGDEEQEFLPSNIPSEEDNPIEILIAKDLKEHIKRHLNVRLKETYELLLEGYTLGEIAKKLNLTHEAVRLRVEKIKEAARRFLR